jgi:Cytochrome c
MWTILLVIEYFGGDMRVIGIVIIGIVIAVVLGCGQHEDTFQQDVVDLTGQPPEVAYVALKCAKCHGAELEGQRTAPKLTELTKRWDEDRLIDYLRDPKAARAAIPRLAYLAEKYPIEMPAYPHTDEQVLRDLTGWMLTQ